MSPPSARHVSEQVCAKTDVTSGSLRNCSVVGGTTWAGWSQNKAAVLTRAADA
jgi:hypothetical protein